jgi:hypothetical protein
VIEHGPHSDDVGLEPTYEVELGDRTIEAGDLGEALAVAADLAAEAGHRDGLTITCDGKVDEGLTELAREGLRPVRRTS